MGKKTNLQILEAARQFSPQFSSLTAKLTAEEFEKKGFDGMKTFQQDAKNLFWELTLRLYTLDVEYARVSDPLEDAGYGEYFNMPYGAYIQRVTTGTVKPLSPVYKDLEEGKSKDPFVVHKPKVYQRFFELNFDYQSLITLPDDFQLKEVFLNPYGVDAVASGVMSGLQAGYTNQKFLNKLECLNAGINSSDYPLKESQKIGISITGDEPTVEEMRSFIYKLRQIISTMKTTSMIGAYNAQGFESKQDMSRLKLLVRPYLMNAIKTFLLPYAFHDEFLSLGIDIIEVKDFGGLQATKDGSTQVHPVYDDLGHLLGFNDRKGQTDVTTKIEDVKWKDTNATTVAILSDVGAVFECMQVGYQVEPIRNPRGLYTNFWASSPNNVVAYDSIKNFVVFQTT